MRPDVAGLGSTGTKDTQAVERLRDNGQLARNGLVGVGEFPSDRRATWRAPVLRVLRQWNGLTQAQVARRCEASTDSVRAWERGRQQPGP